MAREILPLHVIDVGAGGVSDEITFKVVGADGLYIPYRYPINAASIANHAALVATGKLRAVAPTMPNNDQTGKFGLKLPRTEKLILLVKGVALAEDVTFYGSEEYGQPDFELTIPAGAGKIYAISAYDAGLHILPSGRVHIGGGALDGETVSFALVARM